MNVKRYIAGDVQEAMQKIRMELGRDAVILHTRKIKAKGLKGFFSKSLVEVVAAVEEETSRPKVKKNQDYSGQITQEALQEATQALLAHRAKKELQEIKEQPTHTSNDEIESLKSQMKELTQLIQTVVKKVESTNTVGSLESEVAYDSINEYETLLSNQFVQKEYIEKVMSILKRQVSIKDTNDGAIRNAMRIIIRDMIGIPYKMEHADEGPQVYFFVGPTGVGKTTTLAKIAAKLSLVDGKKVGLVTADTYRIAAVDQLKTYSEILNMPIEVIYEPSELQNVLKKYSNKDYILIDTAGRNHKSNELQEDLTELLKYSEHSNVFLVISLTTSSKDIESILKSYHFIEDYKLIFTKLDEAACFGSILNTRLLVNKPLSFITNGQSVPDDISIADPDTIANWLMGD
jgi:flagellar biosynthesis protein FlhF